MSPRRTAASSRRAGTGQLPDICTGAAAPPCTSPSLTGVPVGFKPSLLLQMSRAKVLDSGGSASGKWGGSQSRGDAFHEPECALPAAGREQGLLLISSCFAYPALWPLIKCTCGEGEAETPQEEAARAGWDHDAGRRTPAPSATSAICHQHPADVGLRGTHSVAGRSAFYSTPPPPQNQKLFRGALRESHPEWHLNKVWVASDRRHSDSSFPVSHRTPPPKGS